MNELQIVKSQNFGEMQCNFYQDKNENILMTREQVGQALEYSTPNDSIRKIHERHPERLNKFSVSVKVSGTDGKLYDTILYSSKGVYEICRYSQQPKADAFYDWVYEALESIRKHGMYAVDELLDNPDIAIMAFTALKEEREKRKALEVKTSRQEQIIGELKPKADYTDLILKNKSLVTINQISKDYGMSACTMNKKLHELGVQYKQSGQWLLYEKYHSCGYTHSETVQITHSDGRPDVRMHTKWTQKGRLFLYNLLKNQGIFPVIEQNDRQSA